MIQNKEIEKIILKLEKEGKATQIIVEQQEKETRVYGDFGKRKFEVKIDDNWKENIDECKNYDWKKVKELGCFHGSKEEEKRYKEVERYEKKLTKKLIKAIKPDLEKIKGNYNTREELKTKLTELSKNKDDEQVYLLQDDKIRYRTRIGGWLEVAGTTRGPIAHLKYDLLK